MRIWKARMQGLRSVCVLRSVGECDASSCDASSCDASCAPVCPTLQVQVPLQPQLLARQLLRMSHKIAVRVAVGTSIVWPPYPLSFLLSPRTLLAVATAP
jgi:hypothetical protein